MPHGGKLHRKGRRLSIPLAGSPKPLLRKVLINGGQKLDVAGFKLGLGQCQLADPTLMARPDIRHVPCCAHSGLTVCITLHHRKPHQRLYPGHENLI